MSYRLRSVMPAGCHRPDEYEKTSRPGMGGEEVPEPAARVGRPPGPASLDDAQDPLRAAVTPPSGSAAVVLGRPERGQAVGPAPEVRCPAHRRERTAVVEITVAAAVERDVVVRGAVPDHHRYRPAGM